MAKTYLDEIIEYPAKAIQQICNSKECIGLLLNKNIQKITEDDVDEALDKYIYDYEYIDNTTTESAAFVWVDTTVPSVSNKQIKGLKLYVTIACSKDYMDIDRKVASGISGNRRDNLARYIDKTLNNNDIFGIGTLKLNSVTTLTSSNPKFTVRELCYTVPDFNIKENLDEVGIR